MSGREKGRREKYTKKLSLSCDALSVCIGFWDFYVAWFLCNARCATVFWSFEIQLSVTEALASTAMTADSLFETTSIPGHLAPTPERLERLLSKQTLEELYEVEEQPFAR